jgi:hypothetical protein
MHNVHIVGEYLNAVDLLYPFKYLVVNFYYT